MDKTSITLGLQIGRILAGQRRTRVPVAFLYNGVRLPKLPEATEGWRFVFINLFNYLYVTDDIKYVYDTEADDSFGSIHCFYTYRLVNGSWKAEEMKEIETAVSLIKWANFDVLQKDGSVFLEASEPVPVYE